MSKFLLIKRAKFSHPEYVPGNKVIHRFNTMKEATFCAKRLILIDMQIEGNSFYEYVCINEKGDEYQIN